MRQTYAYKVSTTKLGLQDLFIDLDYLTEEVGELFRLETMPMRPYEEKDSNVMDIDI